MLRKRSLLVGCLAIACAALTAAAAAQAAEKLTVYTAFENEQLAPYKKAFEQAYPEIEIQWVRDSTGIVTARLLAEKNNPQADAIWGLAASSLLLLDGQGMLLPYAPKGLENLKPEFQSSKKPPTWTGNDAWMSAVCFNTVEAQKKSLPKPETWDDLLKPVYKGQITMPNPASSGTGFLTVSAWLQTMGAEKAWKYMDALNDNIASYTHSGSKPCRQAAAGEYAMGISIEYTAAAQRTKGAPIEPILLKPGVGWDMEAGAIIKGTKKLEAAQKLMDFSVSKKANELYNDYYAVVAYKGVKKDIPNYPAHAEEMMIKSISFEWAAENRDKILAEWTKRYDSKSEPK